MTEKLSWVLLGSSGSANYGIALYGGGNYKIEAKGDSIIGAGNVYYAIDMWNSSLDMDVSGNSSIYGTKSGILWTDDGVAPNALVLDTTRRNLFNRRCCSRVWFW